MDGRITTQRFYKAKFQHDLTLNLLSILIIAFLARLSAAGG